MKGWTVPSHGGEGVQMMSDLMNMQEEIMNALKSHQHIYPEGL